MSRTLLKKFDNGVPRELFALIFSILVYLLKICDSLFSKQKQQNSVERNNHEIHVVRHPCQHQFEFLTYKFLCQFCQPEYVNLILMIRRLCFQSYIQQLMAVLSEFFSCTQLTLETIQLISFQDNEICQMLQVFQAIFLKFS